jgi:DNA-binding NarL/FixJ family response regulator
MTSEHGIGIVIADDHPVVRMGVRNMLEADAGFRVLAEASDGIEALQQIERCHPDVLLLDLSMPQMSGMDTLRELLSRHSDIRTVLLASSVEKTQMLEALRLGVRGIVTKCALPTELHECIRAVLDGRYWAFGTSVTNLVTLLQELMRDSTQLSKPKFGLTPRGLQITALIAEGLTNKDIAAEFKISEETVKHHLKQIFDKTGVSNRLELAIFAMNHGLTRAS